MFYIDGYYNIYVFGICCKQHIKLKFLYSKCILLGYIDNYYYISINQLVHNSLIEIHVDTW